MTMLSPAAVTTDTPRFFGCSAAGVPERIVCAPDDARAWFVYARLMGIQGGHSRQHVRETTYEEYLKTLPNS